MLHPSSGLTSCCLNLFPLPAPHFSVLTSTTLPRLPTSAVSRELCNVRLRGTEGAPLMSRPHGTTTLKLEPHFRQPIFVLLFFCPSIPFPLPAISADFCLTAASACNLILRVSNATSSFGRNFTVSLPSDCARWMRSKAFSIRASSCSRVFFA